MRGQALEQNLCMLLAYVDESGNTGDPARGGTQTFTLGCVIVDADDWPGALDDIVAFRRRLRDRYGLKVRAEVKANYLIRGSGSLRDLGLSPNERRLIYRAHLRMLAGIGARAFAVVIDKRAQYSSPEQVFDAAWSCLFQRLRMTSKHEDAAFLLIHDEGENDAVRKWSRRARRRLTSGSAINPGQTLVSQFDRLIDDPVPRNSQDAFLIQLADLVAYAGFRDVLAPSKSVASVCPGPMWKELGDATHSVVNRFRPRASPGVVVIGAEIEGPGHVAMTGAASAYPRLTRGSAHESMLSPVVKEVKHRDTWACPLSMDHIPSARSCR